jgi:glyoxalase family protein
MTAPQQPPDRPIAGIHHITAIAGAAQTNLDFYTQVLGLRLVKTTVNFDDPGTYHLYYGDRTGQPGSILTFFPWAHAVNGRTGAGMATTVAFAIPDGALDYWTERLDAHDVDVEPPQTRFGAPVVRFQAPDGLQLELVVGAEGEAGDRVWTGGDVPAEAAIRGFFGTTLRVPAVDPVAAFLTEVFGWAEQARSGRRVRFAAPGTDAPGRVVDVWAPDQPAGGRLGAGTVHHVAFRAADETAQLAWRDRVTDRGIPVTEVKDRQYFKSIYFRDPEQTGGVLFEIATDGPGFLTDEDEATLGTALKLPPWLEGRRDELEDDLTPLRRPPSAVSSASPADSSDA